MAAETASVIAQLDTTGNASELFAAATKAAEHDGLVYKIISEAYFAGCKIKIQPTSRGTQWIRVYADHKPGWPLATIVVEARKNRERVIKYVAVSSFDEDGRTHVDERTADRAEMLNLLIRFGVKMPAPTEGGASE